MSATEALHLRVDATAATGLGHFMRCFALAQYWRDIDHPATFVSNCGPSQAQALEDEGIALVPIEESHPASGDLTATLASIPPGGITVLDGYAFDPAYQRALADERRVLVIDDFGHQPAYAGHALLNPNFSASEIPYPNAPARRLLGPAYALLRRAFRGRNAAARPPSGTIDRLLVSLGGADARNDSSRLIRLIDQVTKDQAHIRVIVGPLNPHAAELQALANRHDGVELRFEPGDICAEMLWCDFAISSAGSISAELAALGIPALLFAVADNQIAGARSIAAAGAAGFGGDLREMTDNQIRVAVEQALGDAARIASMRVRGPALVDGDGVARVADFLREGALD